MEPRRNSTRGTFKHVGNVAVADIRPVSTADNTVRDTYDNNSYLEALHGHRPLAYSMPAPCQTQKSPVQEREGAMYITVAK